MCVCGFLLCTAVNIMFCRESAAASAKEVCGQWMLTIDAASWQLSNAHPIIHTTAISPLLSLQGTARTSFNIILWNVIHSLSLHSLPSPTHSLFLFPLSLSFLQSPALFPTILFYPSFPLLLLCPLPSLSLTPPLSLPLCSQAPAAVV